MVWWWIVLVVLWVIYAVFVYHRVQKVRRLLRLELSDRKRFPVLGSSLEGDKILIKKTSLYIVVMFFVFLFAHALLVVWAYGLRVAVEEADADLLYNSRMVSVAYALSALWMVCIAVYVRYLYHIMLVSEEACALLRFTAFFVHKTTLIETERIVSVKSKQIGVWSTLFRYGTIIVTLQMAGSTSTLRMKHVANPATVVRAIEEKRNPDLLEE